MFSKRVKNFLVFLTLAAIIMSPTAWVLWKRYSIETYCVAEEDVETVLEATEEYRIALQACIQHKDQETAEILTQKSIVNIMYLAIQPNITIQQRLDVGVPIAELNERAIDVVSSMEPQTRYTCHWIHTLKCHEIIWKLTAMGRWKDARQLMKEEIAYVSKWREQLEGMTKEERVAFLSRPIAK